MIKKQKKKKNKKKETIGNIDKKNVKSNVTRRGLQDENICDRIEWRRKVKTEIVYVNYIGSLNSCVKFVMCINLSFYFFQYQWYSNRRTFGSGNPQHCGNFNI